LILLICIWFLVQGCGTLIRCCLRKRPEARKQRGE
jgi:hypothetical protein